MTNFYYNRRNDRMDFFQETGAENINCIAFYLKKNESGFRNMK